MTIQKLFAFLFSLLLFAFPAWGKAKLAVWPMKVDIWPGQKIGEVHLQNKGDTSVNLQIYATSWDIDGTGKFIEADTGDFVFYPRLLTIPAGEEKSLRVGYNGKFPPLEKSFRLYVHELPEVQTQEQEKEKIKIGFIPLIRLSLPLFVSPSQNPPPPKPEIEGVEFTDAGLKAGVKNPGTHHITLERIEVRLLSKSDEVLAQGEAKPHILRILPQRKVFVEIPINLEKTDGVEKLGFKLFIEQSKDAFENIIPANSIIPLKEKQDEIKK